MSSTFTRRQRTSAWSRWLKSVRRSVLVLCAGSSQTRTLTLCWKYPLVNILHYAYFNTTTPFVVELNKGISQPNQCNGGLGSGKQSDWLVKASLEVRRLPLEAWATLKKNQWKSKLLYLYFVKKTVKNLFENKHKTCVCYSKFTNAPWKIRC